MVEYQNATCFDTGLTLKHLRDIFKSILSIEKRIFLQRGSLYGGIRRRSQCKACWPNVWDIERAEMMLRWTVKSDR